MSLPGTVGQAEVAVRLAAGRRRADYTYDPRWGCRAGSSRRAAAAIRLALRSRRCADFAMTYRLVFLRHGRSEWNAQNLFTGWFDAALTAEGIAEASRAGADLLDARTLPDVLHTSLQTRAIHTAHLALAEMDRLWIPERRSWRLNERHYGDLTGKDKAETTAEFGADQVKTWRRSFDVSPPPIADDNPHNPNRDPRYASLPRDVVPLAECLKDVVNRTLPYWHDAIVPDLQAGGTVLVAAHGNTLRALVMHLDQIGEDDINELNLPTGVPLLYELGGDLRPVISCHPLDRAIGDVNAAKAAAAAVAEQASGAITP